MQIDWITVLAQIANFLVLVWVLRRLLYGPILRAMERREAAILDRITDAETREATAEAETRTLAAERAALADQRGDLIAGAQEEARALRRDLEHAARVEVENKRTVWWEQLRREKAAFLSDLRQQAAGYVDRVVRRALSDFAGKDLEDAMVGTFLARLQGLDPDVKKMIRAEAHADGRVNIDSAYTLAPQVKARLTRAIREMIGLDVEPSYGRDETLVCGIRMKVRAQTVQWSIDGYLDDLEEETEAYFDTAASREDQRAAE